MIRKWSARFFVVSVSNWTNGFLIREGISATYSPTGVEAGLARLDARSVDFAAADAPLSSAPQKGFVEQFLNYAVGPGQKLGEAFLFAPMPKIVKTAARRTIGAL